VNSAGSFSLSKQQLRDQECAQEKEHGDAKRANIPYSKEPWITDRAGRNVVHAMEAEHTKEDEEAQSIQLGPVIRVAASAQCRTWPNARQAFLLDHLMILCRMSLLPTKGK
jgi:hypothetical protein